MKRLKKPLSLLLICFFVFSMTACSAVGKNVMTALKNSMNMKSYSFDGHVDLKVDIPSDSAFFNQLNGYNPFPLDLNVSFDGKSNINENSLPTSVMNYNVDFMDIKFSSAAYLESKAKDGQVNINYLIKSPRFLKSMLGLGSVDADYLFYDLNSINKLYSSLPVNVDPQLFNLSPEQIKNYQNQYLEILNLLGESIIPNKTATIKTSKSEIKLNGKTESVDLVNIKLNNAQLKELLKTIISNEESFERLLELSLSYLPEEQREALKQQSLENYKENSELFLQSLDTMPNFLGENGIDITLAMNKDNYIVQYKVLTDILIENTVALTLNYDVNIYDINKTAKIDVPSKDKIKYVDIIDYYKNMMIKDNHNITLPESERVKINGSVKDYFPFKANTTYFYKDSESEELQKTTFDYYNDGLMQLTEDYGDYKFSNVYKVTDTQVKNIMFSENDNNIDITNSFPNSNELQLVSPFIKGTKWSNNYLQYEITDLNAKVKTASGTYDAIEITSSFDDPDYAYSTKYYYAKNVGLVKVVYDYSEGETSSLELVKIEKNIK